MVDFRFKTEKSEIEKIREVLPRSYPVKPERGRIFGALASFAEWRVAKALWYLDLDFYYRWRVPNTIYIIDFLILMDTLIPVDVKNWEHIFETSEHRLRTRTIEMKLETKLNIIWDVDVLTMNMAVSAVRSLMR